MSYSLHVKSYYKRTLNLLAHSDDEHLVATRGSKYYLVAENKTEHPTHLRLWCNGAYNGAWYLRPYSKVTIEDKKSDLFTFDLTGAIADVAVSSNSPRCDVYYIKALFDDEDSSVMIEVPVHICDHPVNGL